MGLIVFTWCPCLFLWQGFSASCLLRGNFYGELVFKTVGPVVLAAVMGSGELLRSVVTKRKIPRVRSEYLFALTYLVLIPATNAALRALPCEVNLTRSSTSIQAFHVYSRSGMCMVNKLNRVAIVLIARHEKEHANVVKCLILSVWPYPHALIVLSSRSHLVQVLRRRPHDATSGLLY